MAEGGPSAASATSSYSNNDVNEQFLKSLMEMGIHREDARQALRIVNNRSLEDALAVVFGESPSFFAESVTSASGASVEQATQVSYESNVIPTDSDTTDQNMMTYKMLFIVNGSLSMSSGKIAAQVAHAAVDLYQKILDQRLMAVNFWRISGQRKIVVRGDSAEELLDIEQRVSINKSVVKSIIRDAGRTEIASGSITCLGLFGTDSQLDPITGHLKLMNDCLKCSGTNIQQQKSRKTKQDMETQLPSPPTNSNDTSNTQ
ncbi:unnamed protein product [Rotaria sordida]|uniref:peptidyl-tRNA hydrolase n=2 Tax=Rotaria sordida TaxID=392033 RepID=A0A818YBP6_9BILA|nr:unnamed protein product [Rotaria sordida]CAF3751927.1 unnamed protein product [Rotaria sordida]CAF3879041.1 unnamed protein product [Rotaria sordida]